MLYYSIYEDHSIIITALFGVTLTPVIPSYMKDLIAFREHFILTPPLAFHFVHTHLINGVITNYNADISVNYP